jgi:hypothetical protein
MDTTNVFQNLYQHLQEIPFQQKVEIGVNFLGILTGAGISIVVFWLGIRAEKRKEIKRLRELDTYIKDELNNLRIPINAQIKSIKKFSMKLSKKENLDHAPEYYINLHSKNIKWISQDILYKIFITGKKGNIVKRSESFRKLNADLDYIDTVADDLKQSFNYFMETYSKNEKVWNDNMVAISTKKDDMAIQAKHELELDPNYDYSFLKSVDNLMYEWSMIENYREAYIAVENLLLPLQTICRASDSDPNSLLLLKYSNNCIHANENIIAIKHFTKRGILSMAVRLKNVDKNFKYLLQLK